MQRPVWIAAALAIASLTSHVCAVGSAGPEFDKQLAPGDKAPQLAVEKWLKGSGVTTFEDGKVYVVDFWATWCVPCIASVPRLTELQTEYKDKGVTIIGVSSVDKRGNSLEKTEKMVADKGEAMGYQIAWDKERMTSAAYMEASHQRGIPCSFVVDQKGRIAFIGHPMVLPYVLHEVVGGTWDIQTGPQKAGEVMQKVDSLMQKARRDPAAAAKSLEELDRDYPYLTKNLDAARYEVAVGTGEGAKAAACARKYVDWLIAEKNSQMLNHFAWSLVDPNPEHRAPFKNVDLAVEAATKAVEFTKEKNAAVMDTLARCWYVKGDRSKAIEWQKKALAAEDANAAMKLEFEKNLAEYQSN